LKSALPNHDDIYRDFDLFEGASQSNAFSSGVFYFISGNDQHIQIAILCDFALCAGTEQNDLFWVRPLDKTAYTFSGVTSQGGSMVAIIIRLSLAAGLRQASHFRSMRLRPLVVLSAGCAIRWLRYVAFHGTDSRLYQRA
jgi:hypothetical protein